jgi:formylglycine-generating enzyme required for sulfatase activity/Tol biopolymer transport system component
MHKYVTSALLAAVLLAGCSKSESVPSTSAVAVLPVVESKAGGAMVLVPAGSYTMGDGGGRADEVPHLVSVSAFYLDKVPVTQELFSKVMGVNPSKRKDPQCPVERTQWTDAVRFCNMSSELEGLTPCYNLESWECNFAANGYRLPTEAEWEYACRAGGTGKYGFGDDEKDLPKYAWLKPHSQGKTQLVGQKSANRLGLFDMHGNVWQWCNDWYSDNYYKESPSEDPRGPATGTMRVLRGGAWDATPDKCRAAYRHKEFPVYSDACFGADSYGFRRARSKDGDGRTVVAAESKAAVVAKKDEPKAVQPSTPPVAGKLDVSQLKGTIVFVSDRSGSLKIWSMRASGKGAKQLTKSEGADADPRFSPDGKRILYTTLRGGFPEVWQMNRDGSRPKFVTKGSQGSWAPSGRSIVFINDNQTYVRDLDSGKERLLTPKSWERCGVPAFSPDGQSVAVASRHLGSIGIFLLRLDGKEPIALKTEEACCTPCWSKDGTRILCQTVQGHIHEVGIDGKGWDQLTFGADVQHDARYSPDGRMILFCRAPSPEGPWQICVQRIDGGEDEFVALTKEGSNLLPDWHGDE